MSRPRPIILDISEHQLPNQIDYVQLAKAIDWVIVRVQYGSLYQDQQFQTHLENFKRLNVPVNVYAWVRGTSEGDMAQEAEDFYRRAREFQPSFWWLDIEEGSMANMVRGSEGFRRRLKDLGAKKVGAYIANHRYHEFGFRSEDTQKYDAIWLPTYGQNTGKYQGENPTATTVYDLHQYTSNGRLPGYAGPLDLSRIASNKPATFFTAGQVSPQGYQVGDRVRIKGIFVSSDSKLELKPARSEGTITKIISGAPNPYLLDGIMGWVNDRVIIKADNETIRRYQVRSGETLSGIGVKLGVPWPQLAERNQLANPNLIYPGQWLFY